jgi:hypothetical protein
MMTHAAEADLYSRNKKGSFSHKCMVVDPSTTVELFESIPMKKYSRSDPKLRLTHSFRA